MRRMYVAALASALSVEYLLLDPVQFEAARAHPTGLFDYVQGTPALADAPRFTSVAALREHCAEHGIFVAGDLHSAWGEKQPARLGNSLAASR